MLDIIASLSNIRNERAREESIGNGQRKGGRVSNKLRGKQKNKTNREREKKGTKEEDIRSK